MKTLFANGCSWTYGGGLDSVVAHTPHVTWPYQLKELLEFDNCVNLAEGCGSNQRTIRTTINWLLSQDKDTLKNTTAVIQWTELSRYEYYYPPGNTYLDIEKNWVKVKAGLVLGDFITEAERQKELKNSIYRYETYTDLEGLYTHLSHLETLHSLFNQYGVKYYYWNFATPYHLIRHPIKEFILSRYNWLEPAGRHIWEYDRISEQDPHPSILGHKQIAMCIKEAMNHIKVNDEQR
jgi:hypothetical protein